MPKTGWYIFFCKQGVTSGDKNVEWPIFWASSKYIWAAPRVVDFFFSWDVVAWAGKVLILSPIYCLVYGAKGWLFGFFIRAILETAGLLVCPTVPRLEPPFHKGMMYVANSSFSPFWKCVNKVNTWIANSNSPCLLALRIHIHPSFVYGRSSSQFLLEDLGVGVKLSETCSVRKPQLSHQFLLPFEVFQQQALWHQTILSNFPEQQLLRFAWISQQYLWLSVCNSSPWKRILCCFPFGGSLINVARNVTGNWTVYQGPEDTKQARMDVAIYDWASLMDIFLWGIEPVILLWCLVSRIVTLFPKLEGQVGGFCSLTPT